MRSAAGGLLKTRLQNSCASGFPARKLFFLATNHHGSIFFPAISFFRREKVVRVVCDYIAGMTDHYVEDRFRTARDS